MMPGGTEPESLFAEGADLAEQGRWIDALDRLARAAALQPDCAAYHNNAGVAAWKAGDTERARQYFEAALRLDPRNGDLLYHLGRVFESMGDWRQALDCYVRAAETLDEAKVHHRTGLMLAHAGRFALAARAHRAAVDREPSHAEAWHALATNLCSARSLAAADHAWRRAAAVEPGYQPAISHRLLAMHYLDHADPEPLYAAHRDWGARVESQTACLPAPRAARNRRLRIGYLSPDLDAHSVSYFVEPLLRHRDRSSVEVIGFWDRPLSRGRARLESLADRWHDVSGLTHSECADLIHSQEVDVLVDLAGHTSPRNRLIVLAARPARIQVTAIGYPNTTGLTRIDYRLSDSICDPAGRADEFCSEKIMRIEPCFLCYAPPDDSPEILEAGPDRPFTFGCFNALPKISDGVLDVWAEILKRTPRSRLLLKNLEFADPDIRGEALGEFARRGIGAERIELRPPASTRREHLCMYAEVDVALDPFPYNGTTTTCEALWMGAPVVALEGDRHVSRVSTSLLKCCGLGGWVARSRQEYARLAVRAAGRRRGEMERRTLREHVRASSLLDGRSYTRRFEELLRAALAQADQNSANSVVNC